MGIDQAASGALSLVSVCVPTVRPGTLIHTVRAILAQDYAQFELIVVGQGADEGLAALGREIATSDSRVRYVHLPDRGVSLARNAGARLARGQLIAFTDDDCEPASDWLTTLVRIFDAHPDVGLVGGRVVPAAALGPLCMCPSLEPAERIYDPAVSLHHPPAGWDWIGANFAVRRSVLERVGGFDEYLGAGARFPSGEDTDFGFQLESARIPMASSPLPTVHHTYGARCGVSARVRQSANYARGNGALAGKLDLMGDPRGRQWLESTRSDWKSLVRKGRLAQALVALYRRRHFTAAFDDCRLTMRVNPETALLELAEASIAETP